MGPKDNVGDLVAGEWRQHWRPSAWGVETTLETKQLGSGDDVGDLAPGDKRRCSRVKGWGVETTSET